MSGHDSHQTVSPAESRSQVVPTISVVALSLLAGWAVVQLIDQRVCSELTGKLHASRLTLRAPFDAVVGEMHILSGVTVDEGAALLTLSNPSARDALENCKRKLNETVAELEQTQARVESELAWKLKDVDADIFAAQLKSADLLRMRLDSEMERLAWEERLHGADGLASRESTGLDFGSWPDLELPRPETRLRAMLNFDAARNAIQVQATQISLCDRRITDLQSLRSTLAEKVARANGIHQLERRQEELAAEIERVQQSQSQTVNAPTRGVLGIAKQRAGERVEAGTALVDILHPTDRFIVVYAPAKDACHFELEGHCRVRFPDGTLRTGRVDRIAPQAKTEGRDRGIAIRLRPTGKRWPSTPVGADVNVLLNALIAS